MIDMTKQTDMERDAMRYAVVQKEGVLISVFDVLRRIPRRVLMVLKLNDLTRWVFCSLSCLMSTFDNIFYRSLDRSLNTTHADVGCLPSLLNLVSHFSQVRVFLVMAKHCVRAVWKEDRKQLIDRIHRHGLLSINLLYEYFSSWWYVFVLKSLCFIMCRWHSRRYQISYRKLSCAEAFMDFQASLNKRVAWFHGLWSRGLVGAHNAASGLLILSAT